MIEDNQNLPRNIDILFLEYLSYSIELIKIIKAQFPNDKTPEREYLLLAAEIFKKEIKKTMAKT